MPPMYLGNIAWMTLVVCVLWTFAMAYFLICHELRATSVIHVLAPTTGALAFAVVSIILDDGGLLKAVTAQIIAISLMMAAGKGQQRAYAEHRNR